MDKEAESNQEDVQEENDKQAKSDVPHVFLNKTASGFCVTGRIGMPRA